jgi:hypothetical protein
MFRQIILTLSTKCCRTVCRPAFAGKLLFQVELDPGHIQELFKNSTMHMHANAHYLKGHCNEVDFLVFLHKPVRHRYVTLRFGPFRF